MRPSRTIDTIVLDLRPALRPGEPEWTEDTEANAMRYKATGKEKQVRFDRVLLVCAHTVGENRGGARTPAATAGWERARAHSAATVTIGHPAAGGVSAAPRLARARV
jgi:hypothetical protein